MAGTLLLTFDCEGKWGVVDRLAPRHRLSYTNPHLEDTYRAVIALLKKYGIGATFAFTGAFAMSRLQFAAMRPEIEQSGAAAAPWMQGALKHIQHDEGDGWFAPECFRVVRDSGAGEIASHGFSHIPWGAPFATRTILDAELSLTRQVPGFGPDAVETFVYPRNQVAHKDLLRAHGFRVFREARPSLGRPANLMRELNVFSPSEIMAPMERLPVAVPAGYFLNWRHGARRWIPIGLTVRRWQHIIRHAGATGGVVHAWSHPEDFIDGDSMFCLLERVLRFAADEREAGRLRVLTCKQLVRLAPAPESLAPQLSR